MHGKAESSQSRAITASNLMQMGQSFFDFSCPDRISICFCHDFDLLLKDWFLWKNTFIANTLWNPAKGVMGSPKNRQVNVSTKKCFQFTCDKAMLDFNLKMLSGSRIFKGRTIESPLWYRIATSGMTLSEVSWGQGLNLTSGCSIARTGANEDTKRSPGRLWSRWSKAEL